MWAALGNVGAWLLGKLPEGIQALISRKRQGDKAAVDAQADAVLTGFQDACADE